MFVMDIPNFKEVVIMSLTYKECSYRYNNIKGGGSIPRFGSKITLTVTNQDDLVREVLNFDTAGIWLPEIDLDIGEGGVGCPIHHNGGIDQQDPRKSQIHGRMQGPDLQYYHIRSSIQIL